MAMSMDERDIGQIVERVVQRLNKDLGPGGGAVGRPQAAPVRRPNLVSGRGVFETVDQAAAAAHRAFDEYREVSLDTKMKMVEAMRRVTLDNIQEISRMAVEETGMGRYEHKIAKNTLAAEKTPGPEILQPWTASGDNGLTIMERAPYGVIGAITPTTNPTETILCNAIGMLSGGNTVVFNVHPRAKNISNYYVSMLNNAIEGAGGPSNLITTIASPTIKSAGEVMKHPGIRILVVTGGEGVVNAAMGSGKRTIAAGPGNPPVLVDETVDLGYVAENVIAGASLDNNIICIDEKVLVVVADVADALKREMVKRNVVEITGQDIKRLEKVLVTPDNQINRKFVGQNANVILKEIGIDVGDEILLVLAEVDEKHPFVQLEQLMPVLPMVRVANVDEGITVSQRVEHYFCHTAVMYSRDIAALHKMAKVINTSIFVKNAPSVAGIGGGGEGYTSFTIASPTGEGLTTPISFTRERRCTLKEYFRFV